MTEEKIYADDFNCSFGNLEEFLLFLKDRKDNSKWLTAHSKAIRFQPVEQGTALGDLYMQLYEHNGQKDVLIDTMENTGMMLRVNGDEYPVRSCALKTILERARISGHALSKVNTGVFTEILNHCMDVASGDSLVKVADKKVSAVHGGDPKDYSVLEMLPLFESVKDFLNREFPGNRFLTATFDHAHAMGIWALDGQANDLLSEYRRELAAKGLENTPNIRPGVRVMTSDVGVSGANLYPILLIGTEHQIVPLGYSIKTEHKGGADLKRFQEQLSMLYARFKEAMTQQIKLMDIEIRYPETTMLRVLKRIGAPKKASYEASDMLTAQYGGAACTAYDLYLAMSEVIFSYQCDGSSGSKVAQIEEIVARALSVNWRDYDHPGEFKW